MAAEREPVLRRNAVVALSLLAIPPFAAAQEWVSYANSPQGDQGFVDRASLKVDGNTRRIWTLLEKATPASFQGRPLKNWVALVEVDCSDKTHRSVREAGYLPDGTLFYDARFEGPSRPVVPNTMGEIRLEVICGLE